MKITNKFIVADIIETGYVGKSNFQLAYDTENRILHIFDDSEHRSTSLINTITDIYKQDVLRCLGIKDKNVRCFIYQDEILSEYYEENGQHPFYDIEEKEKNLLYPPFQKANKRTLY
ncbi:hypothetical protein [Bacillus sp. V2I10]|uniref:hypothetical protein n=1 Tax=Bacillus sp. V2I10 TaxID=3042276 RepID=UPI002789A118|nr:hypothetical protein [Bacillus sp. V2I10]MDQ0862414.1 hypothetical protein [Bacillus sp. V2I10]